MTSRFAMRSLFSAAFAAVGVLAHAAVARVDRERADGLLT